jgi:MoaA/NifB/PqqE/SkfB family radical SAM enzyme
MYRFCSVWTREVEEYSDRLLECVELGNFKKVPAPLCVQMQVSATCSTHCRMCEHWNDGAASQKELTLGQWGKIFSDLQRFNVKAGIFSGGEPLMRKDLPELLSSAAQHELSIGLLTNGTPRGSEKERRLVLDAIKEHVSWIAVSIDGRPAEDGTIRNPLQDLDRPSLLKEFCTSLGNVPISATLTLQQHNINMDLMEACRYINEELGISRINFKLATGSGRALKNKPPYLVTEAQLRDLLDFLWQHRLSQDEKNNLDYLRRCFAEGTFNVSDAAEGAPLRTFYGENNIRCYTPFLFSLIDSDGSVYPCCHLYRDNHTRDNQTARYREEHRMGNAVETDFQDVWNEARYEQLRERLKKVDPEDHWFAPCGECTRHCQPNRTLTRIQEEYKGNREDLARRLAGLSIPGETWF